MRCYECGHMLPSCRRCVFCDAILAYVRGSFRTGDDQIVEVLDPALEGCSHWRLVTDEALSHVFYAPTCAGHILEVRRRKGYRAVVPVWRLREKEVAGP